MVLTGGCLCGAVRYRYEGEVGAAGYCHCADCRRTSGSAFGVSVRLASSGFEVVHGKPAAFSKVGDSGNQLTRHFCGACGSPLFTTSPARPDRLFVKAGSLDDTAVVVPATEAWTTSRVSWATIPRNLETFEYNRQRGRYLED